MNSAVEAEFQELHAKLRKLEQLYNPSGQNLHFECLCRVDAELYVALLELAEGGLQIVHSHREYFSSHRLYDDGMFWYDLFLMISAAAGRVHHDEAQATIPAPLIKSLTKLLVRISEFALVFPKGDITKRNYEALANTLWAFHNEELVQAAREKANQMNDTSVQEFVNRAINQESVR